MWIDTSDRIDHDQYQMQRLWSLICQIEDRTETEAHLIEGLCDKLKDYQDKKLKRSYFIEYLNKYIDQLNK